MKQLIKSFFCLSLLVGALAVGTVNASCDNGSCEPCETSCNTNCSPCDTNDNCDSCDSCDVCRTTFVPRSPSTDIFGRRWMPYTHKYDMCELYGSFQLSYEYKQSFDGQDLANCMFGRSTLTFTGSDVADRGASDLVADYFGLPRNFQGSVTFNPRIQNHIVDLDAYVGLDEWYQGLWIRLSAPIQHTRWTLNACDSVVTSTNDLETTFPAGYMSSGTAAADTSILNVLGGQYLFGDMQSEWKYGKFDTCTRTETGLASFDFQLGWDFWQCENYHVGAYLLVAAPTGTDVRSDFVFSPVVGNGKMWKVGGGLTAHWELWSCDDDQSITAYFEGNIGHLFKKCQTRSFEFNKQAGDCCMNRYMLLKEFDANNVYQDRLINAINFTTRHADVSVDVEGGAALSLVYRYCAWHAGLGYEIYGRSKEDVCIKAEPLCNIDANARYGFKGCQGTHAFVYTTTTSVNGTFVTSAATVTALNSTASSATACSCGTVDNSASVGGDNTFAVSYTQEGAGEIALNTNVATLAEAFNSNLPVTIAANDINVLDANSGALPSSISHKVFGQVGYTWMDCDWAPYLELGGEGEFKQSDKCCTLSQWGVWLKGGISF